MRAQRRESFMLRQLRTPAPAPSNGSPVRVPGDWLLHPVPLAAASLLALNDHVLKQAYANWFTGKLSDVAGMIFFPFLLLSLWEFAGYVFRRPWHAQRTALLTAVLATGTVFALIKLSHVASGGYDATLGAAWAALDGNPNAWRAHRATNTVDPTDLLALPFLLVPWWLGRRRLQSLARMPSHTASITTSRR